MLALYSYWLLINYLLQNYSAGWSKQISTISILRATLIQYRTSHRANSDLFSYDIIERLEE